METMNIRERMKPTPTESCFATLKLRLKKHPHLARFWPLIALASLMALVAAFGLGRSGIKLSKTSAASDAGYPFKTAEIVHASDGLFSVWNYDSGLGGTMPDYINTVRWWDEAGMHDQVFNLESGRLGWVERIGVFPSVFGTVYIVAGIDKVASASYHTRISAFRIDAKTHALKPIERFFPEMPGTDELRTQVSWNWWFGEFGSVRRPVEVGIDEERREIRIAMAPNNAWQDRRENDARKFADRAFVLRFNGREMLYQPEGGGVTSARTTARLAEGD